MNKQARSLKLTASERQTAGKRPAPRFSKAITAAVITAAVLLSGCAIKAVPDRVPLQKEGLRQDLTGVSLVVMSASKDASLRPILTESGVDVGFVGDRQTWSRKLTDALAGELARKGAVLRTTAPLKVRIAVTEVTLVQTGEINQFKVKVSASSSRGWTKNYEASSETTTGAFETVDSMTRRLAGLSLAEINKVILADRDFLAQLGKRKTDPSGKARLVASTAQTR